MAFYRIRFARIFPLLALLLLVLSVAHRCRWPAFHIDSNRGTLGGAVFAALTFHLNWYEAVHGWLPPSWTVLWSLSVEEMFYLFFPLLCIGLLRRKWTRPLFFAFLSGLIIFGPFARTPWYTGNEIWGYQSYLGNMDNVALGCVFALLANKLERHSRLASSRWPLYLQLAGTVLALFIVIWDWPKVVFGWRVKRAMAHTGTDVTVLGLGVCLIMLGSVLRNRRGWRWLDPVRWLGRYSYEIYLSHEFVVMGVLSIFLLSRKGNVGLWMAATVLLSGALGYLLSRFISEPLNQMLRG